MTFTQKSFDQHSPVGRLTPPEPDSPEGLSPAAHEPASARTSVRIAHLSDPHLSRLYYREHLKSFKLLLRAILEEGFDHIVMTGDIVSTADPDDYYLAREVLATAGILDSRKLTLVPGNHDVFGGPHRATDILSFPRHIRSVDYRKHLDMFAKVFAETFEGVERLVPGRSYPFVKSVGPVSILGLNSIPPWSFRYNLLGTNGKLSRHQIEALERLAETGRFRDRSLVVAMHHHFNDLEDVGEHGSVWRRIESDTMRMMRRRLVLKLFNAIGVDVVLHGHIHKNEVYRRNGILFANGAGAVCDDPHRLLKFNALTVQWDRPMVETRILNIPYQVSTAAIPVRRRPLPLPQFAVEEP